MKQMIVMMMRDQTSVSPLLLYSCAPVSSFRLVLGQEWIWPGCVDGGLLAVNMLSYTESAFNFLLCNKCKIQHSTLAMEEIWLGGLPVSSFL